MQPAHQPPMLTEGGPFTISCPLPKTMIYRVAKKLRQLPIITEPATDKESFTDEDQLDACYWRPLKLAMHCTRASIVVRRITWLHEVVYSVGLKPAANEHLSIPMFVHGYLIVMKGEEGAIKEKMATHLEALISDAELYSWERVRE